VLVIGVLSVSRRDQLITSHTDVAKRIALRMARRCPTWIPKEDLIAAGMLGLTEAAERYDDSRTEPFLAFAEHRIRGAILDELRRGDILPRRARRFARRVAAAIASLEQRGTPASDDAVAEALGMPVDDYRTTSTELRVEIAMVDGDEVVDEQPSPACEVEQRDTRTRVRSALAGLDTRDLTILMLHFVEELPYQQIGAILGITPTRVCQLVWRAIGRVRSRLFAA
jgi:RNA polymerase sigma factor for flagellar operon FliA